MLINKEKKEKFAHILAGIVILVHAYEKYDKHEGSYTAFIIAGVIFLGVALLHHRLVKSFPYIDGGFFVIESILYAIIAADYFSVGKKGLPWCYVIVTIIYLFIAFKKGKQGAAKYKNK